MGNERFILTKQNNAFFASINERHLSSTNSLISLLNGGSICQENTETLHYRCNKEF